LAGLDDSTSFQLADFLEKIFDDNGLLGYFEVNNPVGRLMRAWFKRGRKVGGWFAASLDASSVYFAHGRIRTTGKPSITLFGTRPLGGELPVARYDCSALLQPTEYQVLMVEAPNVPREELKGAIRWKIKDMIDYHVDDATVDVLDIPPADAASRVHMMYAVTARNEQLQSRIREFEEARIPISVIDIRETAQRNIATLYESDARGVALVYFAEAWGLLTINYKGELYLARRLDFGLEQLAGPSQESALERVVVEIQRTLDHFERQYRGVAVARVLLAPMPRDLGLPEFVRGRLGVELQSIDLGEVLNFDSGAPDTETQWRLFHHFGAALREEPVGL
jgi:MSHA biogenesis protein MshI